MFGMPQGPLLLSDDSAAVNATHPDHLLKPLATHVTLVGVHAALQSNNDTCALFKSRKHLIAQAPFVVLQQHITPREVRVIKE